MGGEGEWAEEEGRDGERRSDEKATGGREKEETRAEKGSGDKVIVRSIVIDQQ